MLSQGWHKRDRNPYKGGEGEDDLDSDEPRHKEDRGDHRHDGRNDKTPSYCHSALVKSRGGRSTPPLTRILLQVKKKKFLK